MGPLGNSRVRISQGLQDRVAFFSLQQVGERSERGGAEAPVGVVCQDGPQGRDAVCAARQPRQQPERVVLDRAIRIRGFLSGPNACAECADLRID